VGAKKLWVGAAAVLASAVFVSIFIYLNFYAFGYLEVVEAETGYKTTVTLKWHGRDGTLLGFDNLGRDNQMAADWSRVVDDGDEFTVTIPLGWSWLEIRYGLKIVDVDCYGKLVG
jgi:hypothetical protein